MDDAEITELVRRLSRSHPSGGRVVERAALTSAGVDATAVIAWLERQGAQPEAPIAKASGRGLHGSRDDAADLAGTRAPLRYVVPAAAFG